MREADTAQICYRINDKWRELCGSRGEQFIPSSNEKPFRRLDVWTLTGFRPGVHPTSIKYLPYRVRFREIRTDTAPFCKASANRVARAPTYLRVWPVIHCTNEIGREDSMERDKGGKCERPRFPQRINFLIGDEGKTEERNLIPLAHFWRKIKIFRRRID